MLLFLSRDTCLHHRTRQEVNNTNVGAVRGFISVGKPIVGRRASHVIFMSIFPQTWRQDFDLFLCVVIFVGQCLEQGNLGREWYSPTFREKKRFALS